MVHALAWTALTKVGRRKDEVGKRGGGCRQGLRIRVGRIPLKVESWLRQRQGELVAKG